MQHCLKTLSAGLVAACAAFSAAALDSNKVFRGGYVWQNSDSGWSINMPKRTSGTADYYDVCYGYRVVCDAVAK